VDRLAASVATFATLEGHSSGTSNSLVQCDKLHHTCEVYSAVEEAHHHHQERQLDLPVPLGANASLVLALCKIYGID
jgi:hypothetical protein